ncbi:MAG: HAMP domain-containing protein [Ruminococcaceae bacterium]|nr:HAMP domain-containing protein [Oscillospiraceae bacterium]
MKIRSKMLLPMVAIALVMAVAILVTVVLIFSGYVDDTTGDDITYFSDAVTSEYENMWAKADKASRLLASDSQIVAAVEAGDQDAILARAAAIDESLDVDFCTITDAEGTVLVRTHEPENFGDSVANQQNVQQALAGSPFTTLEEGSAVKLSVRAGVPVKDADGNVIGVVSSGYRLDTEGFVDHMKKLTGAEVTVFYGDTRLSTTVTNADGTRAVGTTAAENVSTQVLAGGDYSGKAQILGREAFVKYVPIRDANGAVKGMLFVGRFTDMKNDAVFSFILQGGGIALALLLVAIVVIFLISRRITAPIHVMVDAANRMADGDVDVDVQVDTRDEMRQLADAFERMIASSREQADVISRIAEGDLSVGVHLRSERDVVGKALREMLAMNNTVFAQINHTAEQVAAEAHQIADGAQNLAQGSTEQAGVVEELSASIATVAARAKDNADVAMDAARLAGEIRDNAEKGSGQMAHLTTAVNEISEASQAIGNVIKVIDDIAFQTNILALNAAVEAARAGEHGKGFAVVADEVRNLAAKSAEAAKDTGAMISNSIEKAAQGAQIAEETAASLADIVSGINQSGEMVRGIATSSEEASDAVAQVNIGIDQVAAVVQRNSATAEQSAAASEEMSSQSEVLRGLVARFKLYGDGGQKSLEAPGAPPAGW